MKILFGKTLMALVVSSGILFSCSSGTTHEDTKGASTGDMPTSTEYNNNTGTDADTIANSSESNMGSDSMGSINNTGGTAPR